MSPQVSDVFLTNIIHTERVKMPKIKFKEKTRERERERERGPRTKMLIIKHEAVDKDVGIHPNPSIHPDVWYK